MKLSRTLNQAGIALPIIILIIVVVLGGAGGAYYFVNKDKDSGPAVVNKEVSDKCNEKLNDKDLCKLAASWNSSLSYTATIRSVIENRTSTMTVKSDGKGNTESKTEVDGNPTADMIMLDGSIYSKTEGSDTWLKYPNDDPDATDAFSPDNFEIDFESDDLPTYTKEGKEDCGDRTCFKYTFTDEENGEGIFTVWFDDKDYLVRKISGGTAGGTMEMTYEYGNVTISEPSPVQDFSSQLEATNEDVQRQIEEAMRQQGQ